MALEYPEDFVFTSHHFDVYSNNAQLQHLDINLPDTRYIEVLVIDTSFSYSSQIYFGSWRHYFRTNTGSEIIIDRFGRLPINERVIKEIIPSTRGFLRFYPLLWVADFSVTIDAVTT